MANQHILVVSPNSELSHLIADKLLRPLEYQVTLAKNTQIAETSFRSLPPDLVILDVGVDNKTGMDFAAELTKHLPIVPIVLVGSDDRTASLEMALQYGATGCICPPLIPEEILAIVERGLERRVQLENWIRRRSNETADSLQRRVDVLETLQKVGRTVTASLDLDVVLTSVVDVAVGMTGAEEGSLLVLDEESGDLYMRASRNFQDEFVRTFRLPIKDSLAGEVVRTGKPAIIDDDAPQKIKTAYLVRSLMYVPMRIQNRVIGVLGVDNRTSSQTFSEQHLTLVSALADYAAIAIENARLFEETEAERKKLEAIVTDIGDGVIVVGEDWRIILANQSICTAFGVYDLNVVNQPLSHVFHDEQLIEMFKEGALEYPFRCELALDDGRVMNAQLTEIPGVGAAVTMQDITHLKELDRIKSDFVNTVSHDLRSPLTAILGYVELISRVGPVTEQQRQFIERVQVSVHNITNLINDLLELGRIESGFDARKEFVPLPVVIQYSIDSLESSILEKEHELVLDMPDQVDKVFADPTRLRQLVDNLVGNAIRYTPQGGRIQISLRSENNQVILQVQDNGPGIPPADQPYIFDQFYRASNINSDVPGSGLGLAIVKTIVENHQGRVWVDSTLGEGSTFPVVLPVVKDEI
jgi:two-component system, OmpR family, phosphate regulon sensor histidine kinase PhoR